MKKGLIFITIFTIALISSGCSDTWKGAEKDTKENADWGKEKVNDGAKYVEEKTK